MYLLTNEEMRSADEYTITELGVPSLQLMERAGRALADEAEKLCQRGKALCVCGGGNNGGDGFVCARILQTRGVETEVLFFAERETPDCTKNREKYLAFGGKILFDIPTAIQANEYGVVVDCLVGTGLRGGLSGKNAAAVAYINALKDKGARVLSADIPSGISGKNGRAEGPFVLADKTLCIGEVKLGAVLFDGLDASGEIVRADIGIRLPKTGYAVWVDKTFVKAFLPKRRRNSHKGTYGKAAIVAGSTKYSGAAILAATACARSGAGYVTLFSPQELVKSFYGKQPEILLKSTNDGGRYAFNAKTAQDLLGFDSIAYGMGMGESEEVAKGAEYLLAHYEKTLILDADGLNSLAAYRKEELPTLLKNAKCDVLLTPHVKEFSRLSGYTVEEIQNSGAELAKSYARQYGVCVLLKGAASVITDGADVAVNTAGNSGQAKGGSGDVLSGVIAGLCAMGACAKNGGIAGSYLTGKAAELAAKEQGEYSMLASDVIAYLGRAFLDLLA